MSLTDEDKSWITEQFRENSSRIAGQLREEFRAELRAEIRANWDRTTEEIRRVETSLLTEFHKWASPSEARQRTPQRR
jgi:hypothetical protein